MRQESVSRRDGWRSEHARIRLRTAWTAFGVGAALLVAKLVAAGMTGSRAILSDALESVVNVTAALMVLFAVRFAVEPADAEHPFGHGKVESVSAGVEGAMLLAAAGAIVWAAIPRLVDPEPLHSLGVGSLIVLGTTAANAALGAWLVRRGQKVESLALVADGRHLVADAVTSSVLLGGVAIVGITGWWWLDPVLACTMAAWVLWTGVSVLRNAFGRLVDTRRPELVEAVARALERHPPAGMHDPHDLRVLDAGTERFVSLHLLAPARWTLERTERLREEVRQRIAGAFDVPTTIVIQIEPCSRERCTTCAADGDRAIRPPEEIRIDRTRLCAPEERRR